MTQDKIYIYGRHAVKEALINAPHAVRKVYLAPTMDDSHLLKLVRTTGVQTASLTSYKAHNEIGSHQGVIGLISLGSLVQTYESFIPKLTITPDTSLVLLDELQDPHNVGAIIRSAAAFGVSAVLIPQHNQAPITGAVVKVSAGMAFRIPIISIGNVNTTIRDLKKRGFWVYGLAGEGTNSLASEKFTSPTLFILGNESKGIREKTREYCDILLSIPINPRCESLNVAASTAVVLSAWANQHPEALLGA